MRKNFYRFSFLITGFFICAITGCGTFKTDCKPSKAKESISLASHVEAHQLVKSSLSWNGASLPAYREGRPEITILRIVIPAGQALAKHAHPVINAGVLLRGELTVESVEGNTLHLKAGDAIVEVVGTVHRGKNEGTEPAEILVFYAGVEGVPITVYTAD